VQCNTQGLDAGLREHPVVTFDKISTPDMVHIDTIVAVVGRIHVDNNNNKWVIVNRSRDNACMQFVDEEGNIEYD
jgi:hypothetical protein